MTKGDVSGLPAGDRKGHPHQLRRHVGKARGFRIEGKAGGFLKALKPSLEPGFIEDDFIAPGLCRPRVTNWALACSPCGRSQSACPLVPLALQGPQLRLEFQALKPVLEHPLVGGGRPQVLRAPL